MCLELHVLKNRMTIKNTWIYEEYFLKNPVNLKPFISHSLFYWPLNVYHHIQYKANEKKVENLSNFMRLMKHITFFCRIIVIVIHHESFFSLSHVFIFITRLRSFFSWLIFIFVLITISLGFSSIEWEDEIGA